MEFPWKSNNFFSKEEIELLNEWRKNMAQTPEGKQIIENIETDNKVQENIRMKVLKNLTKQVKEGNNCLDAFGKAIDDKMVFY